jgi:ABC-2 type transport system ATP-binding protein
MSSAIVMTGLTKDYGSGHGLFDLDLAVAEGEVFGFLGPNGAGKTTCIRLLMGVIHATAGSATIFGLDAVRDSVAVKRAVGYLPGELPQYGGMRGSEVVAYLGAMRGGIDQAFMHRPRLLILDEPTGGLDPLNQQTFHQMVGEVKAEGTTVFLSSHVLSEVEETCSRVGIIRDGRLVSDMTMDKVHELRFHEVIIEFAGGIPEAAVRAAAGVEDVAVDGARLTCTVHGGFDPLLTAIRAATVIDLISREPSLESIFLSFYSK